MSSRQPEYKFRCKGCGQEVEVIPSEDEEIDDLRPAGPTANSAVLTRAMSCQ